MSVLDSPDGRLTLRLSSPMASQSAAGYPFDHRSSGRCIHPYSHLYMFVYVALEARTSCFDLEST